MNEIQNYLRVLEDSLEQKKDVLQQILKLTKKQAQIAGAEEFSETDFANSVNEKEILIARLNQLDDGFLSVYNRIKQDVIDAGGLYDTDIRRMQGQIQVCVDTGNEIRVLEERNHAKLTAHFNTKQGEYKVKTTLNSAARSYYNTMSSVQYRDPFFMDKKK